MEKNKQVFSTDCIYFFKIFSPIQWPPASSYNNQLVTQSLSIQHPNLWVPTFNQCIGHRVEGNLPPNNRSLTLSAVTLRQIGEGLQITAV